MLVAENTSGPQIPAWVPDHIAAKALELRQAHSGSAIAVDLIERLMTNTRMKTMWGQLAKRDRKTKGPRYKVDAKFASSGVDECAAAVRLLEFAFNLGRLTLMLPSADNPKRPFTALAQKYRDDAERLVDHPAGQGIRGILLLLAQYCDSITYSSHNPSEAIATEIAHWLKTVFGTPMFKITALITGVITGQEISERKVRTWVAAPFARKSHPAKKIIQTEITPCQKIINLAENAVCKSCAIWCVFFASYLDARKPWNKHHANLTTMSGSTFRPSAP